MQGRILKGIAGFYYVYGTDDILYECKARGAFRKDRIKPLVGDFVTFDVTDDITKKGNIITILPRKSELFRPEIANIDQVIVTLACREPEFNHNLLDRFLTAMEFAEMESVICFTKSDLTDEKERQAMRDIYRNTGYQIYFTSNQADCGDAQLLKERIKGRTTAFAGPSGVGKSTLVNYLCPGALMETGTVSDKIKRGRHTTRHSEIFYVGDNTFIYDTPGFSSFEIPDMQMQTLELCFPDIERCTGNCRFRGCSHITEPSCSVKEAVDDGRISPERYESYCMFMQELKDRKKY